MMICKVLIISKDYIKKLLNELFGILSPDMAVSGRSQEPP